MATHEEVIGRWMHEIGRSDPDLLHSSDNIFVSKDSHSVLYYDREGRGRWGHGRPVRNIPLAMFLGRRHKNGVCLLNGDGMEDRNAMAWQTNIRDRAQREFGMDRVAIIPFEALNAAQIDRSSIKIIQVTQDTHENRNVHLPTPSPKEGVDFYTFLSSATPEEIAGCDWLVREPNSYGSERPVYTGRFNGFRWRLSYSVRRWVEGGTYDDQGNRPIQQWQFSRLHVWAQPENGIPAWQTVAYDIYSTPPMPYWTEAVHRLGACVFRGNDPDGRPHRWISAFDTQEPEPLYFLAQLPDRGKCLSYEDAIHMLAPDIVHQAREQGKHVARQGDIFAIATELPDEAIYENVRTRVRREVAMQDAATVHRTALGRLLAPAEGEIRERGTCPMCDCRPWVGNGPQARRALMIHGTSHTAEEVVVKNNGVCFIRGRMYHNPELETAGRQPEHMEIALTEGDNRAWYLAIRNTVPRQRSRRAQVVVQQDAATTDAPERLGQQRPEEAAA